MAKIHLPPPLHLNLRPLPPALPTSPLLAMRSSSWPGPRGRVRKRSRSGWRDSGDRNRRTWSWPLPSARLTCRLRRCREATAVCMYTHAQHVPRFKPCYASHHSQGQAGRRALGFGALFRGSRCSLPLWLGQEGSWQKALKLRVCLRCDGHQSGFTFQIIQRQRRPSPHPQDTPPHTHDVCIRCIKMKFEGLI